MTTEQTVREIITRSTTLDACVAGNRMPGPREGQLHRNMANIFVDMDIYSVKLVHDATMQTSTLNSIIDAKNQVAIARKGKNKQSDTWFKPVLGSKAIQFIWSVVDELEHFRPCSRRAFRLH